MGKFDRIHQLYINLARAAYWSRKAQTEKLRKYKIAIKRSKVMTTCLLKIPPIYMEPECRETYYATI